MLAFGEENPGASLNAWLVALDPEFSGEARRVIAAHLASLIDLGVDVRPIYTPVAEAEPRVPRLVSKEELAAFAKEAGYKSGGAAGSRVFAAITRSCRRVEVATAEVDVYELPPPGEYEYPLAVVSVNGVSYLDFPSIVQSLDALRDDNALEIRDLGKRGVDLLVNFVNTTYQRNGVQRDAIPLRFPPAGAISHQSVSETADESPPQSPSYRVVNPPRGAADEF